MGNLIIKGKGGAGNKLILQDQAGGAVLTTADSGATLGNSTQDNITRLGTVTTGVLGAGVTGGSGLYDVPGRYFYGFKNNGSNQTISADTYTHCTFQSVNQSHSSFSSSTFTAVAADAGKWFFAAQISYYENGGSLNNPLAQIYHNGSSVIGGYKLVMSSTQTIRHYTVNTTGVLTIAAGDTIKLYGYSSGSGTIYLFGGDVQSIKGTSIVGVKL